MSPMRQVETHSFESKVIYPIAFHPKSMLEIELKARLRDPARFKAALLRAGAKHIEDVAQEDIYFAHPARNFAVTDEALRLRRQGSKISLTYKGPKLEAITKTREEFNIEVSSIKDAREVLKRLGFAEVQRVRKRRTVYKLRGFMVMLDRVAGLGHYVEVEKPGKKYDPKELINFLKSMGVGAKDLERRSYLELLTGRGS